MMNYKVNNHYYPIKKFTYKVMKKGVNFYTSNDYFIKEYDLSKVVPQKKYAPKKVINFYKNYYKSGEYKAAALVDYEVKNKIVKTVYQKIGSLNLEDFIINNKIDDPQGREILKSILDTLLPFERNKVTHGDSKLHNMIYEDKNVYMIDFDHFGDKKEDLVSFIGSVIYNFKRAYTSHKVISPRDLKPLPANINEYHSCCQDVAQAILNHEVNSIQNIIELMAITEGNIAEQNH